MNKRITKVTTKTGDKGTTGMADGSRVSKADPMINSIGEIDELNSLIGYLDSLPDSEDYRYVLRRIQNCLFDTGGSLSVGSQGSIAKEEILYLEEQIQKLNEKLPALDNFILPGGNQAAAFSQYVRAVCRRCERSLVILNKNYTVEENKLVYLNRLSDLMFVIARSINQNKGVEESLWKQS